MTTPIAPPFATKHRSPAPQCCTVATPSPIPHASSVAVVVWLIIDCYVWTFMLRGTASGRKMRDGIYDAIFVSATSKWDSSYQPVYSSLDLPRVSRTTYLWVTELLAPTCKSKALFKNSDATFYGLEVADNTKSDICAHATWTTYRRTMLF